MYKCKCIFFWILDFNNFTREKCQHKYSKSDIYLCFSLLNPHYNIQVTLLFMVIYFFILCAEYSLLLWTLQLSFKKKIIFTLNCSDLCSYFECLNWTGISLKLTEVKPFMTNPAFLSLFCVQAH